MSPRRAVCRTVHGFPNVQTRGAGLAKMSSPAAPARPLCPARSSPYGRRRRSVCGWRDAVRGFAHKVPICAAGSESFASVEDAGSNGRRRKSLAPGVPPGSALLSRRGFRSALLFLFGRYKHLNGRPRRDVRSGSRTRVPTPKARFPTVGTTIQTAEPTLPGAGPGVEPGLLLIRTKMVLGAGLEPARTLLAGTSPCLRYSGFHGAERYNSGSSQRASAGVSSRGQTWLSNPSLCAGGQKPSDPYISRPDIAAVLLPSAFFRVSSRFAAPSRQVITPAASLPFSSSPGEIVMSGRGLLATLCSAPDAPAPPSGEPLRPLTAGQSENDEAQCGSRTRDCCVDPGGRMQCFEPDARSTG